MNREISLVSVNVGGVALLGERRGRKVYSGILKSPVLGQSHLWLGPEGLTGDQQEDKRMSDGKRIHGGPLKAVYAYPRSHYALWADELDQALLPGMFGENITVDDILEGDVLIGEVWKWGDALLEVTSYRRPCFKLDMLRGEGTARAMMSNNRCGWYFKILRPGEVPTTGSLHVVHRPPSGTTILESFQAKVRREPTVPDLPDD